MRFLSKHTPTQAQQEALARLLAEHGLPREPLDPADIDLDQPVERVREIAALRPYEPVAAVGPAHLLERLRRGGHPVVVFAAEGRGRRVDEAQEVRAHALPGLVPADFDDVIHGIVVGALAEITLRDGYTLAVATVPSQDAKSVTA